MKYTPAFAALSLLVPALAFALDFEDLTEHYNDAPFSRAETAGISVLTEVGAVQGNPDGSFGANKTLNRAEFLKIAYESSGKVSVSDSHSADCFPDVKTADWFSKYVCLAKTRGDVGGYPDGFFRPANTVNYAEALKILVELFGYELPIIKADSAPEWYVPYVTAAKDKGVALPASTEPATLLTRGQMARLAAAFLAESKSELDEYRAFERGQEISSGGSSDSSASSVLSVASSSSSSSQSSSSSVSSVSLYPAISHFLVSGTTTPVLADGLFRFTGDDGRITSVEVELYREIQSLDALELIDENGTVLSTLALQSYSNVADTKWRADGVSGSFTLKNDQPTRIGLRARMKTRANGGTSNELLEFKTFKLFAAGVTTNTSQQMVPSDLHFPMHQTSHGRITSIENALATSMEIKEGSARTIGSFTVSAEAAEASIVNLTTLKFYLQGTNVSVSNMTIGSTGERGQCSIQTLEAQQTVTCFIPEASHTVSVSPVTYTITADVSVSGSSSATLQLASVGRGGINANGAARWTDNVGTFNWVESTVVAESGPEIAVTE